MSCKVQLLLLVVLTSGGETLGVNEINNVWVFPHVVQGVLGTARVTTELLILNTNLEAVEVQLKGTDISLQTSAFQLPAGETRTVLFAGSEPEVGWVQVTTSRPVTAHARIVAKAIGESKITSELSYAAVDRGSKWVIPFYELAGDTDVALAIAANQVGVIRISLWGDNGERVAEHELGSTFNVTHLTVFLRQLFPEAGTNVFSGRLQIEAPKDVALAFSVIAVRTWQNNWTSLPESLVDLPGRYVMALGPGGDANILSAQYGFEVLSFLPLSQIYAVRMTHEVARAVSRDSRVGYIQFDPTGTAD